MTLYSLEGFGQRGAWPLLFASLGCGYFPLNLPLLKAVIKAGENLDAPSPLEEKDYLRGRGCAIIELKKGATALWYACQKSKYEHLKEAVKLLLQHGAKAILPQPRGCQLENMFKAKTEWLNEWFAIVQPLYLALKDNRCQLIALCPDLLPLIIVQRIEILRQQTLQ